MSKYPYDIENMRGGNSRNLLKACYALSSELMSAYEPFGQASSTYEDTGYPEMTAIGIRTFFSVPENIAMMRDIGENTLKNIETLGQVVERDKLWGTPDSFEEGTKAWKQVIADIKNVCKRTHDAIMRGVNAYLKNTKAPRPDSKK